jgi:hypothetical protein
MKPFSSTRYAGFMSMPTAPAALHEFLFTLRMPIRYRPPSMLVLNPMRHVEMPRRG